MDDRTGPDDVFGEATVVRETEVLPRFCYTTVSYLGFLMGAGEIDFRDSRPDQDRKPAAAHM